MGTSLLPVALLPVTLLPALLAGACSGPERATLATEPPPASSATGADGSTVAVTGSGTTPAYGGPVTTLGAGGPASGGGTPGTQPAVGTDSDTLVPGELSPETRAFLEDFGRRYLSFDYRIAEADRVVGLQALVTPELYLQLAQPLPPALLESLTTEQRVVTAEPVAVEPIDGTVYAVTFALRTTTGGAAAPVTSDESRTLMVTVEAADTGRRVSDVR